MTENINVEIGTDDINVTLGTDDINVEIEGGSARTTFLNLTDTPASYSGSEEYFVKVNSAGTALEFVTSGSNTFAIIEVDGSAVSTNAPTLDFDGTDFTLTESPTDSFDITLKAERIQDIVGAMFSGNTETGISVTYQDGDGTIDLVVSLSGFSTTDLSEGTNLYFTDERAQDAVGTILADSSEIDFTYSDVTPSITASIVASSIDESKLDISVNASLDLADSSTQPNDLVTTLNVSTTDRVLGRTTAGAGVAEELTATQVRTLINVEDGADVTDTANVTAAGALMDSEVDADLKTLSLPANTTISTFGASLIDDADAATARTTLGAGTLSNVSEDTTPQLGGDLDSQNNDIDDVKALTFNGEVDNGNSGTSDTIDWGAGNMQKSTITGAVTFSFTDPNSVGRFDLRLIEGGAGTFDITWPASVRWFMTEPTWTDMATGDEAIVTFRYNGTNYDAVATEIITP